MKNPYTSFFIAIPLPEKYKGLFKSLIGELQLLYPDIPTVNPETPHFTLYYLTKEAEEGISDIKIILEKSITSLKNIQITVGGFNYFGQEQPRVLYLDVKYPDTLKDFNQNIKIKLEKYSADDNKLSFTPHVTVASIKDPVNQKVFQKNRGELEELFNEVKWVFPITKVILYGANSKVQPELQKPLITLDLQ